MKNTAGKFFILTAILFAFTSSAHAQGFKGWIDLVKGNTQSLEDGNMTSETDTFHRVFYLSYSKPVTPALSYQVSFRTNMTDTDNTDASNDTTTTYQRTAEPALDLHLKNPMYSVSSGYRRQENWSTSGFTDEGRETSDFLYSRFNVTPEALPSLGLQYDKQRKFDYLSDSTLDDTNTIYTVNSSYELPSSDLNARYTINFTQSVNETPLQTSTKTEQENFNGTYNLGYSGKFWNNKAGYSAGYQGTYTRSQSEQFVTEAGAILNERTALGGLSAQGTAIKKDVDVLTPKGSLANNDLITSTGINLSAVGNEFHNMGILISPSNEVDRLYVYVNKNILLDANLGNSNGWLVYKSSFNQAGVWSPVAISGISVRSVDQTNQIFRYEILLTTPQSASFFKVINVKLSSIPAVEVTELEAYGKDDAESTLTNVTSSFNQQLHFSVDTQPWKKLGFVFTYSLDRSDDNPESITSSITGAANNIFSDTITTEKTGFLSNVSRNYGISSTWLTHKLVTTTFQVQRNESFDSTQETDISSNTYNVAFNSAPLPTVDASLSLIRSDSYSFGENTNSNNSAVLSAGTQLYRNVNMITDLSYTNSQSHTADTTSTSRSIGGTIDALLTKKLTTNFNYNYSWNTTEDLSSQASDHSASISYRPGRLININGTISISESDNTSSTSEGILVDWLPVPVIRLNVNFRHTDSEPGPVTTDSANGFVTWYITKFASLRSTYGYTKTSQETESENINWRTSINCRF